MFVRSESSWRRYGCLFIPYDTWRNVARYGIVQNHTNQKPLFVSFVIFILPVMCLQPVHETLSSQISFMSYVIHLEELNRLALLERFRSRFSKSAEKCVWERRLMVMRKIFDGQGDWEMFDKDAEGQQCKDDSHEIMDLQRPGKQSYGNWTWPTQDPRLRK